MGKQSLSREKKAILSLLTVIVIAVIISWVFSGGCGSSADYPVTPGSLAGEKMLPTDTASWDSIRMNRRKKNTRKSDKKVKPHNRADFLPSSPLEHPVRRADDAGTEK